MWPEPEITVPVRRLPHAEGLALPRLMTPQSVGLDLQAAIPDETTLEPGQREAIPTGLIIAVPPGYEAQIRPRSGLSLHHGLTVVNAPGTIDPDYREEVKILVINLGRDPVTIARGDRIAQMVFAPVVRGSFREEDKLPPAPGRSGGFGHTGK